MDMSEDSAITLDIKSNLFRDITKMTSNTTYTINLPKTAHNMAVLEFAGKPRTNSKYPYIFHTARYFRNGLEIIHGGRANVLSISETIEISIYWGLFQALTTLQSSDLKLNELNCTKHVRFKKSNDVDTYEKALSEGVFYAQYNTAPKITSSSEWYGYDTNVGASTSDTYNLIEGKIKTSTAVGDYVTGDIVTDSEYECAIVEFTAGMRAKINQVISKGEYRTWAILDQNMCVLSLAADAGTVETETMPTITAADPLLSTPIGAGTIFADGGTKVALTTISIRFRLMDSAPAGQIEYGVYDPTNGFAETWGTVDVPAGKGNTEITVNVTKFKEVGKLVYVKPSKDGMLYWIPGAGEESNYYVSNGTQHKTPNSAPCSIKYTSESEPIDVDLQAPATAQWLVINAIKAYSTGDTIYITKSTEANARATSNASHQTFGPTTYTTITGPIQPSVGVQYILDLITAQTKVAFGWSDQAKEIIKGLAIPLVTRKADEQSIIGKLVGTFFATENLGILDFQLTSVSEAFSQQETATRYSQLDVAMACTMVFDVQMNWSWDASLAQGNGTSWYYDGSSGKMTKYNYPPCYIEIKVVSEHSSEQEESEYTKTYIAGATNDIEGHEPSVINYSDEMIDGRFIRLMAGSGEIELTENDIVTFELKHPKNLRLRGLKCYNGRLTATLKQSDEVPYGGNFPIGKNLPDIKVTDFLKCLCILTSTFPSQQFVGNTLQLADIVGLWQSKSQAVDWTKKLIPSEASNQPRQTDFSIEDYCQHNIYKWKEDDTVYETHDADMEVANETLEYTQDVTTLPFAPTDGNRIPIYESEESTAWFNSTTYTYKTYTKFKACKDRIVNLAETSEGKAALKFNIDLQSIFDTKLTKLRETIANPHQIVERFNLSDLEILNFDETKPVYLAQYGAYFAVLEIKTTSSGYSEVTMIELI